MARKTERLPIHPATAAQAASRYVETAGFALLSIRQIVGLAKVLPGDADTKLRTIVERIEAELAKVDAILPDEGEG